MSHSCLKTPRSPLAVFGHGDVEPFHSMLVRLWIPEAYGILTVCWTLFLSSVHTRIHLVLQTFRKWERSSPTFPEKHTLNFQRGTESLRNWPKITQLVRKAAPGGGISMPHSFLPLSCFHRTASARSSPSTVSTSLSQYALLSPLRDSVRASPVPLNLLHLKMQIFVSLELFLYSALNPLRLKWSVSQVFSVLVHTLPHVGSSLTEG